MHGVQRLRKSNRLDLVKRSGAWRALAVFSRNRAAVLGAIILVCFVLAALFADLVAPYDPLAMVPEESRQPPSGSHLMGTDHLGRDILSRSIFGARLSLLVGVASVLIGGIAGTVAGLIAGYSGGRVDAVMMRVVDGMLAFPYILLALTVISALGPGIRNAIIAVGISSIPEYARLTRGTVLSAKEDVYVEAARAIGCSSFRTMFRHVFPNVMAPVVVLSTLQLGWAILSVSGLSFLGLGAQPPTPEWGLMVNMGRDYLGREWWISTFPGLTLAAAVMALNLMGDGLREALDPKLRFR